MKIRYEEKPPKKLSEVCGKDEQAFTRFVKVKKDILDKLHQKTSEKIKKTAPTDVTWVA